MRAGLTLHTSNRTERLLEALAGAIDARRRESSPLEPVTVAVPGPVVETWLKLGLARATGLLANVRLRYLSGLLDDEVSLALPGARVADGPMLRGLLLRALHDDGLLTRPGLLAVRGYLHAAGESRDAVDRRRYQLADRLARLFEEYGFSRAEMLAAWPGGTVLPGESPVAGVEAWQRELWLALFGPGGLAEAEGSLRGERWLPLPGALDALAAAPVPAGPTVPVHLFGFSYLARSFHRLLVLLARRAELHVYSLNPCREFWEDVETPAERDRRLPRRGERRLPARDASGEEPEDPFGLLEEATENPLLSLWGRPGREHARLLNELSDCDFDDRYEDPSLERPTLLSRVQAGILDRAPLPPPPAGADPADATLRLLSAPSLPREAEAIAGEVRRLLDEAGEPPLRLHEVAVVVPPDTAEAYRAALATAFGEAGIPWSALALASAAARPLATAFQLLLGLPFTALTRRDVLAAVTHPCLLARVPGASPADLARWCEELGVVRGADREDLEEGLGRDLLSWDQGLRRLALGAFLSGERSGETRPLLRGGEPYLPLELSPDALAPASAFALLVRSLLADARHARTARKTAADWAAFLAGLLDAYLPARDEEEERGRLDCLSAIRALADLPLADLSFGYRIAYEAVSSALLGAGSGRKGAPLSSGVFVSTFVPVRAVPFRVVFAAGLDAASFPARDPRDLLDLRLFRRRAADVTPRERDQYLFLETLLSARERLVLSWVSVDPKSGDPVEPSPLVRELEASGVPLGEEKVPLRRDEEPRAREEGAPGFDRAVPLAARREARARLLGESLRAHLGDVPPDLPATELSRALASVPATASVPALAALPVPPAPGEAGPPPPSMTLSLSRLVAFLRCPVQASAKLHLGLAEDEDDELLQREEEPFETCALERSGLLRSTFREALALAPEGDDEAFERRLEEGWEEGAERLLARAAIPAGSLFARERREQRGLLRDLADALRGERGGALPRGRAVRFGRADQATTPDEVLDPIVLPEVPLPGGRTVRVEVHGATRPLLAGGDELVETALGPPAKVGDVTAARPALAAFVEHAALAASGARPEGPRRLLVLHPPKKGRGADVTRLAFAALSREEARAWLSDLAADLLAGASTRLLPWEAVLESRKAKHPPGFAEALETILDDDQNTYDLDRGPVPGPRDLPPETDADAAAKIDRRFGPFLARVSGAPGGHP